MGAGRGGWYSWDAVDNGGTPSARRLRSELQTVVPGDVMPAIPGATDAFVVAAVDPPRDLVLTVPDRHGGHAVAWEHVLEPVADDRTRLIVRGRVSSRWVDLARAEPPAGHDRIFIERAYSMLATLPNPMLFAFAGIGHRFMEARHLRGIQRRAAGVKSGATFERWRKPLVADGGIAGRQMMRQTSGFNTPAGEAKFLAAYDNEMQLWPVPYEQVDVGSRFGTTHVVICGPKTAPPLVLLHGYMATSTMWWPNIGAFSKDYRVYAVDVMGQPGKSRPDEPICNVADFVSWLSATLDALHLDRVFLTGMSFGGWLALNYAAAAPERVRKLVLLSPGGLLPMVRQFMVRGMAMVWLPTRLTVNSFFRWLGFSGPAYANLLNMVYLGIRHFRMPTETARVMPAVVPDEALRTMKVPTLLLIGEHEVISDPARALLRARRLIPDFEGELVWGCRHDMCASRHRFVDARVLDFLGKPTTDHRVVSTDRRSVA